MSGNHTFWQDREILFDISAEEYALRSGEAVIAVLDAVEDTKGNNGETGTLTLTNLRILWHFSSDSRTNLCIGFNCITSVSVRGATSRLRGLTRALYINTRYNNSRFEFVFSHLHQENPRMFSTVSEVWRSYDSSRVYRDLKLRSAIIQEGELVMLPQEEVLSKKSGVWNLSTDQGNLGILYVTNIRIVWYANLAEYFNVSVPYVQIESVTTRDSKFGVAFVVDTSVFAGSYILGFRVDPKEKLQETYKEINALWQLYSKNPILGVNCEVGVASQPAQIPRVMDDTNVIDEAPKDGLSAYYEDEGKTNIDREPVYDPTLGLAIEKLRDGTTIDSLWHI